MDDEPVRRAFYFVAQLQVTNIRYIALVRFILVTCKHVTVIIIVRRTPCTAIEAINTGGNNGSARIVQNPKVEKAFVKDSTVAPSIQD